MAIVIEVLSKNNKTIAHHYYDKDIVSIGRGYKNDLRLDDPYICESHLQIKRCEETGSISYFDEGSLNGCSINGKQLTSGTISRSDIITLGRTRLRFFDANHRVEPTSLLSSLEESLAWLNNITVCILLTITFAILQIAESYYMTFDEVTLVKLFTDNFWQIFGLCVWPLLIVVMAKMVKKEVRIVGLFSVMWLFLISIQLTTPVIGVLYFNFDSASWLEWLDTIIFASIFFSFIWFTLFLAFHQSSHKRNVLSILATGIVLVFALGLHKMNDDFSPRPDYDNSVYPPMYLTTVPVSSIDFAKQADKLFEQIDKDLQAVEGQ
jgi:hypothetical protein